MSNIDNRELKSKTYILGIRVNNVSKDRLLTAIEKKIIQKKNFYIVTPNPELVLASTKNKQLKDALNGADFAIPDG
ncbi:MAG: Glycosyl transferase, WecB/TagA/CpsF family, partial [Candidatus Woesebacteria bacterium GW2011_GWB1_41_10]